MGDFVTDRESLTFVPIRSVDADVALAICCCERPAWLIGFKVTFAPKNCPRFVKVGLH